MSRRRNRRRGVAFAVVLVAFLAVLGTAALTVDVGMLILAKQQLQDAADAAALAGVSSLQIELDAQLARDTAVAAAARNEALGKAVTLDGGVDVEVGAWDPVNREIIPFDESSGAPSVPDGVVAVRARARRTSDAPDGPVPTYFAKALGFGSWNATAEATAGLTVSKRERPPVEAVIVQDQSGSFADEFPYAKQADAEFVRFMGDCYAEGDRTGLVGFGYHPNCAISGSPKKYDTWLHNDYALRSNEEGEDGLDATIDAVEGMPTIPYNAYPDRNCYTNLYTGMLKAAIAYAPEADRADAWDTFINSLEYNGVMKSIGWWRRNCYSALQTKINTLMNQAFENADSEQVMVIVSDGMPWYHENGFPDTRSQDLCQYIADQLADQGVRIHTVTLDQSDRPGDGSMGADSQFNATLVRNGGYAFYTYDAQKLANLMVGVGQVEVGEAKLIH